MKKEVSMKKVIIRALLPTDWPRVKEIYESGMATGLATFETSAPDWARWNKSHSKFARRVASLDEKVIGWAALSPVSDRCVYGGVVEVSVYVSDNFRGQGIGKLLLQELVLQSECQGIWTLQAGIFTENVASVRLHESVGFRLLGRREKIGKRNNEWKDNFIMERRSKVVGID